MRDVGSNKRLFMLQQGEVFDDLIGHPNVFQPLSRA